MGLGILRSGGCEPDFGQFSALQWPRVTASYPSCPHQHRAPISSIIDHYSLPSPTQLCSKFCIMQRAKSKRRSSISGLIFFGDHKQSHPPFTTSSGFKVQDSRFKLASLCSRCASPLPCRLYPGYSPFLQRKATPSNLLPHRHPPKEFKIVLII